LNPPTGPGWTATSFPEYLQPVVGSIFWRLQSGDSLAQATARAERQAGFPPLTPGQWQSASDIARRTWVATGAARLLTEDNPAVPIGAVFQGVNPSPGTVGLRVVLSVTLTNGQTRDVSILVNATANSTIGDILTLAEGFVLNNGEAIWGSAYPIEAVAAGTVAQLSGIPWDNAVFEI
jgi:hypothetical protein